VLKRVIDGFSSRVVGWSMRARMTAQLVTDALIMAICVARSRIQRLLDDHGRSAARVEGIRARHLHAMLLILLTCAWSAPRYGPGLNRKDIVIVATWHMPPQQR
jgi:transposase InsO family protein